MNGNAALDLLMQRLGNKTETALRTNCLTEMTLVQSDILEKADFKPWFLQAEDAALVTVASQEYVTLPSDFASLEDDDDWAGLWYYDTTSTNPDKWIEVKRDKFLPALEFYLEEGTGAPERFDIINGRLYLRPIPDIVYTIRLRYSKTDSAPTDAASANLWLTNASQWLISATGDVVARLHLQNAELADSFARTAKNAKDSLYQTHLRRVLAGGSYTMGESV